MEPSPTASGAHPRRWPFTGGVATNGGAVRRLDRCRRLQRGCRRGRISASSARPLKRAGPQGRRELRRLPCHSTSSRARTSTGGSSTPASPTSSAHPGCGPRSPARLTTRRCRAGSTRCVSFAEHIVSQVLMHPDRGEACRIVIAVICVLVSLHGASDEGKEASMKAMKIGLQLGYWGRGRGACARARREAEAPGYDSVWTVSLTGSTPSMRRWRGGSLRTEPGGAGTCCCASFRPYADRDGYGAMTLDDSRAGASSWDWAFGAQVVEGCTASRSQNHWPVRGNTSHRAQVLAREKPVTRRAALSAAVSGGTGLEPLADRESVAGGNADHPGRGGAEERRHGRRDRRRLAPYLLLAYAVSPSRRRSTEGFARPGARRGRGLRGMVFAPTVGQRRRRARR